MSSFLLLNPPGPGACRRVKGAPEHLGDSRHFSGRRDAVTPPTTRMLRENDVLTAWCPRHAMSTRNGARVRLASQRNRRQIFSRTRCQRSPRNLPLSRHGLPSASRSFGTNTCTQGWEAAFLLWGHVCPGPGLSSLCTRKHGRVTMVTPSRRGKVVPDYEVPVGDTEGPTPREGRQAQDDPKASGQLSARGSHGLRTLNVDTTERVCVGGPEAQGENRHGAPSEPARRRNPQRGGSEGGPSALPSKWGCKGTGSALP